MTELQNLQLRADDDAWYLPQIFAIDDARRIVREACEHYAKNTLGRDKSIAEEIARYFQA